MRKIVSIILALGVALAVGTATPADAADQTPGESWCMDSSSGYTGHQALPTWWSNGVNCRTQVRCPDYEICRTSTRMVVSSSGTVSGEIQNHLRSWKCAGLQRCERTTEWMRTRGHPSYVDGFTCSADGITKVSARVTLYCVTRTEIVG